MAALHALANLSAFRSSSTTSHGFSLGWGGGDSTTSNPCAMVAKSEALPRLMALLNCQDPRIVAPAIALLNNLCADNENRDKVCSNTISLSKGTQGANPNRLLLPKVPQGANPNRLLLPKVLAQGFPGEG
jgi:hypothetical protein